MALVVYWYDFVCFGIVVAAYVCSLWVLWRRELATRCEDNTVYESLLLARPDIDGFVEALPRNHVGSSQLWTSCWKGVRPGWLLCTRFISLLVMVGFLFWDMKDWSPIVYIYYTEWTFTLVMVYFALATVTSAYGCWVSSIKPSSENEAPVEFLKRDAEENGPAAASLNYRDKEIRVTIQLQSRCAEPAIRQRAGFWGYFMQSVYQTSAGAVILTDLVFWCIIVPFGTEIAHLHLTMVRIKLW
uniref:Uncharacterized protein MANES_01G232800 n=1 Tax=Rhizophora mucronata TaxID=61149 RepID=A0A2P2KEN0_RHIMU